MAQAWQMEIEAAQRYTDFADAMEMHNNVEVAAMFRTMASYESKHADDIMATMGWSESPPLTPRSGTWPDYEAPETTPGDEVHYLMQPLHALQLALAAEQRAERFFAELARVATVAAVRAAALELQAEEKEHVRTRPRLDEEGAEARTRLGGRSRSPELYRLTVPRCRSCCRKAGRSPSATSMESPPMPGEPSSSPAKSAGTRSRNFIRRISRRSSTRRSPTCSRCWPKQAASRGTFAG